jgi:hydroxymethylbilane synthase
MSVGNSPSKASDGQRPPLQKTVLGTRGSELALAQTKLVEHALRAVSPSLVVETKIISTSGDKGGATVAVASFSGTQAGSLRHELGAGRKGLFTKEIEDALRREEIDVAVHSAKDLPSATSDGLEICATLPRASVDDVFITKERMAFDFVPRDGMVATSSVRRQYQIHWKRPDIRVIEVRGNVPTRLRKLIDRGWHGIILARAGLERLGLDLGEQTFVFDGKSLHYEMLRREDFLPAGGQGVIAMQIRRDDNETRSRMVTINHARTLLCLRAEREFLRLLGGNCNCPIGVLATIEFELMTLQTQIFPEMEKPPKYGRVQMSLREDPRSETAAEALYVSMYGQA